MARLTPLPWFRQHDRLRDPRERYAQCARRRRRSAGDRLGLQHGRHLVSAVTPKHAIGRLSRRRLLVAGAAGVATGLAFGERRLVPRAARAQTAAGTGAEPTPLPGGVRGLHFYPPGRVSTVSTIDDFSGMVGVADLLGNGTGQRVDGTPEPFTFRVDNRFMAVSYITAADSYRQALLSSFD